MTRFDPLPSLGVAAPDVSEERTTDHRQRTRALELIRQAVIDQHYVLTPHALLEMTSDRLDVVDIEPALLTGRIARVYEGDPRGVRYEVIGRATDLSTDVGVVVRFAGPLLIITVYQIKP